MLWMPHSPGAKLLLEDKVQSDLWLVTRIVELCRILPSLPLPVPIRCCCPAAFHLDTVFAQQKDYKNSHSY